MKLRLNKYLASLGVASRRKVDILITEKKISVNGQVMEKLGTLIDPDKDKILVEGHVIQQQVSKVYILLNKPPGVISSVADEFGRQTVLDLVKVKERIYPVGRLDEQSQGLILLTNDGALSQRLTHPKFHIPKTYLVKVLGNATPIKLQKLREGVYLKEGKTKKADVILEDQTKNSSTLRITLFEGKNRQIRRMCGVLDLEVVKLIRTAIGEISINDLKTGSWRYLDEKEIVYLQSLQHP